MLSVARDRPVDPLAIKILKAIDPVARSLGIEFLVTGATARDILLVGVFGLETGRGTRDVDLAIAVDGWPQFEAIKRPGASRAIDGTGHRRRRGSGRCRRQAGRSVQDRIGDHCFPYTMKFEKALGRLRMRHEARAARQHGRAARVVKGARQCYLIAMIPVIDLGPYLGGRPHASAATAAELGGALQALGFFVIVNHGIPQTLIEDTFAEARRFHAQPMDAKLALRMNEHNNGYMMLGRYAVWTSDVNANDKPDLNEAFFIKRERGPEDPLVRAGRRFAGPNQWPANLPGFRERVLAYTDAVDALGRKLLPLCATALGLPPDTFDGAFAESQFSFRLTHYPPVAAEANQFGIAPHTDANFMTFLAQSEVPGLQVRMPDGTWVDVPYVPGSFAVNSGDMMQRWTNHRFKSTPHRALPPVGRPRYAIPYFMGPHLDTEIACLPTCQGPGHPPRYAPITYAAYLDWWYDANYNAARQRDVA